MVKVEARTRITLFVIFGVSLVFGLLFGRQAYISKDLPRELYIQKKLRVLTYSTFASGAGPGDQIIAEFQKTCNCKVEVQTAGDAGLLLERLRLAKDNLPYDVVIGLDQNFLERARQKIQWRELAVARDNWVPEIAALPVDPVFIPFDWSPLTFIYRGNQAEAPPKQLQDLLEPRFKNKLALQEPRSSSPGMQFFSWILSLDGQNSGDFLRALKPNVASLSPSWAFSYGVFKNSQADYVFSYITSLAFHWGIEQDRNYQAVQMPEGHPLQIEFAAVPANCRECELAEAFVKGLVEPEAQKVIMQKNFMFPVLQGLVEGTIYAELPRLKVRTTPTPSAKDLSDWDNVFKH